MSDLDNLLQGIAKQHSATPRSAPADNTPNETTIPSSAAPPPTETAPIHPRPIGRPKSPIGHRWEDQNKRAAFYLPHEMLDRISAASHRAGITKSELVRQAVNGWLNAAGE